VSIVIGSTFWFGIRSSVAWPPHATEDGDDDQAAEQDGNRGETRNRGVRRRAENRFLHLFALSVSFLASSHRAVALREGGPNARFASARTASASRRLPNMV
jgi:hypothetical protein